MDEILSNVESGRIDQSKNFVPDFESLINQNVNNESVNNALPANLKYSESFNDFKSKFMFSVDLSNYNIEKPKIEYWEMWWIALISWVNLSKMTLENTNENSLFKNQKIQNSEANKKLEEEVKKEFEKQILKNNKQKLAELLEDKWLLWAAVYKSDELEEVSLDKKWISEPYIPDYSKSKIEIDPKLLKEMTSHIKNIQYNNLSTMDELHNRLNSQWMIAWVYEQKEDKWLITEFIDNAETWSKFVWNMVKNIFDTFVDTGKLVNNNIDAFTTDNSWQDALMLSKFQLKYDVLKKYNDPTTWFSAMLVRRKEDWELTVVIRWTDDKRDLYDDKKLYNNKMPKQLISAIDFIEALKAQWLINPDKPIDIVWHSLWWAMAQALWAIYKWWKEKLVSNVYTFNAPWVKSLVIDFDENDLNLAEKRYLKLYKDKIESQYGLPNRFDYIVNVWSKWDVISEFWSKLWQEIDLNGSGHTLYSMDVSKPLPKKIYNDKDTVSDDDTTKKIDLAQNA